MRDLKTKLERKAKEIEEKVMRISIEITKLKGWVDKELEMLREPLAIEIDKMR